MSIEATVEEAVPFVKWVGGKRTLLKSFAELFPLALEEGQIHTYCEPFLGGGAVFFSQASRQPFERIWLSDINPDLVLAYQTVRDHVEALIEELLGRAQRYFGLSAQEQAECYAVTRQEFNAGRLQRPTQAEGQIAHVARFIFLNKTCYGGMFRVNRKGLFNVPFGKHKRPQIVDPENLLRVSRQLAGAEIVEARYHALPDDIGEGSFVYFDPPYRPLNATSSFTRYHGSGFDDDDQAKLAALFRSLDERGALVMLSNSDPKNEDPNDHFFEELYEGFFVHRVHALRKINSNYDKRGHKAELVITNYALPHLDAPRAGSSPQLSWW